MALGKDVTTAEAWKQAKGNPNKLAMSSIVPHERASENNASVYMSELFARRYPSVVKAMRNIASAPNSKWNPLAPLTRTEMFETLADLMDWALPLRRVARRRGPKVQTHVVIGGQVQVQEAIKSPGRREPALGKNTGVAKPNPEHSMRLRRAAWF